MLHLIPAPLHRQGLRLAHRLRKHWWKVAGRQITGCRVLALDEQGRVLLIRHSYGSGKWMPPGGGLARGETPIAAALRELHEETGCKLIDPAEIDCLEESLHGAPHRVHIVMGRAIGLLRPDGREILAARFFALDGLPDLLVSGYREALPRWLSEGGSDG